MADLSPIDHQTIKSHPLGDALSSFCNGFRERHVKDSHQDVGNIIDALNSQPSFKNEIARLLAPLQIHPAAQSLLSKSSNQPLDNDIIGLTQRFVSSELQPGLATPLFKSVLAQSSDAEIWFALFKLIETNRTPPSSYPPAQFKDTPLKHSSASTFDSEKSQTEIEQRIHEELRDCVYNDVEGFFDRYLENKSWSPRAAQIHKSSKRWYRRGRWSGWPNNASEINVLQWLQTFQDRCLSGLDRTYYRSRYYSLRGSDIDRKLDYFLARADLAPVAEKYDWSDVLVIGELKANPDEDAKLRTLIQLAAYAREVFGAQPGRRFTHGFTLCGSQMRLYVFDKSGAFSSSKFDIHEQPERFVKALAGYALMSEDELGLNTAIKRDHDDSFIISHGSRILLEDKPIASQKAIVCRGTTCFRARQEGCEGWQYVVKFSWPAANRTREGDLLKLAKEKGVEGIAQWVDHQDIMIDGCQDTIANLRSGLVFGKRQRSSVRSAWMASTTGEESRSQTEAERTVSMGPRSQTQLADKTPFSAEGKRKRSLGNQDRGASKRSRLRGAAGSSGHVEQEMRSENEVELKDTLKPIDSEIFSDRAHCCLVVSPSGRPIHDFHSVKEFVEVLRDVVQAHRSLLVDGNILHRDISQNNIIIAQAGTKSIGMLIDLDLAKKLGSPPSGVRHRTGTVHFMAIEVLKGFEHTYRHDLESLFYVFLWICIGVKKETVAGQTAPARRQEKGWILREWFAGTYQQIALRKQGHMTALSFQEVLAAFQPRFEALKALAQKLRSILFPLRNGVTFTGTPPGRGRGRMYNGIIDAFNEAIEGMGDGAKEV